MRSRGVHLQYSFDSGGQRGATIDNPLFELLTAVREQGSIQHAAQALGASYRHVWGSLKRWEEVLGEDLVVWVRGQPARLTPFAERLMWAEARARARLTPHIEALRVELERVLAEALDGNQQVLTVYASHDFALPLLRDQASASQRLHIDLRFAGSMDALRALSEGRCAVAGFHVPPLAEGGNLFARALKPLLKPGRHKLIGCTRRTQGLMVAPGNPLGLHGLADVAALQARFVGRQPGSGTRLLTDHLVAQQHLPAAGFSATSIGREDSHNAVAAAVASGEADAGVGVQAAASAFGLDFVPLVVEDYYLVCLKEALDSPGVTKLRSVLSSTPWRHSLVALPGYEATDQAGQILSLTQALPWWHFRTPKAQRTPPVTVA